MDFIKRARTININLRWAYELCILHVITFIEGGMSCSRLIPEGILRYSH